MHQRAISILLYVAKKKTVITRGYQLTNLGAYTLTVPFLGTVVGGVNCLDWDAASWFVVVCDYSYFVN